MGLNNYLTGKQERTALSGSVVSDAIHTSEYEPCHCLASDNEGPVNGIVGMIFSRTHVDAIDNLFSSGVDWVQEMVQRLLRYERGDQHHSCRGRNLQGCFAYVRTAIADPPAV